MSDSVTSARLALRLVAIRYAARDTHLYEFARPDGGVLPDAINLNNLDDWYEFHQAVLK